MLQQYKNILKLDQSLIRQLNQCSDKEGIQEQNIIISGVLILLNRYMSKEEISIQVFREDIAPYSIDIHINEASSCKDLWQTLQSKVQLTPMLPQELSKIYFKGIDQLEVEWQIENTFYLQEQLNVLLKQMLEEPESKIETLDLLTPQERTMILEEFNHKEKFQSRYKCVMSWFEEIVSIHEESLAAICESDSLTYKALNEQANQVGSYLREKGIKPNDYVGIMTGRSLDMLVAIMGVLKAGAAYVPIDPQYPEERIAYILADSGAKCIVGNEKLDNIKGNCQKIYLRDTKKQNKVNLEILNKPSDVAYVIYTSGTTGKPKGVMITQENLCHIIEAYQKWYEVTEKDVILQFASMSFDQSVWDIFGTLLSGATSCLITDRLMGNLEELAHYMDEKGVTFAGLTPTVINELNPNDLPQLRLLESGGEKANLDVLKKWHHQCRIFNTYGPTECTINALSYEFKGDEAQKLPIGKPIGDVQVYILDSKQRLVPIGMSGELCIAGKGVAKGYLNRKALTDEKFIDNPFGEGKLYKTGDLARWLSDGNVDYLGRIDEQVKIRGLRIELGEIEMVLRKQPIIQDAVVVVQQNNFGESYLSAFIVSEHNIDIQQLKMQLKEDLPQYMVPQCMLQIPKMPRTTNGKVDKHKLPQLEMEGIYEAPTNPIEKELCETFSHILGITRIGIHDDFFALGGHSLRATKLINQIAKRYGVQLTVRDIFNYPTVKGIGQMIKQGKTAEQEALKKAEAKAYYPLSPAQKGMYILTSLAPQSVNYNMAEAFWIEGKLNIKQLEKAFQTVIKRHASLRTSFIKQGEDILQKVTEEVSFYLEYECIAHKEIDKKLLDFVQPFDLKVPPLIRGKVYEVAEKQYILAIDIHHIIADGSSYSLIIEELSKSYNEESLKEVVFQYIDYTQWQQSNAYQETLKSQEAYWLACFKEKLPNLEMPLDEIRPFKQSFEGDSFYFELTKTLFKKLEKLCSNLNVTLNMLLLASYSILLQKYSQQEELVIGLPISGRDKIELQEIVGMFVNTLPICLRPEGEKAFNVFIEEVKEQFLKGYENADYPFLNLVEKLNLVKDASHNPIFDMAFVFQNTDEEILDLKGTKVHPYTIGNKAARFDLTLVAQPVKENIIFEINYCTKLYHLETIQRLSEGYIRILEQISEGHNQLIKEIDVITPKEYRLLEGFNGKEKVYETMPLLHELFEQQVQLTPNQVAAQMEGKLITYKALNEQAEALAFQLQQRGVGHNSIVGIYAERSIEMLVGLLGILKAGGAYLPIDPMYPVERIQYILENSKVSVLLTQKHLQSKIAFEGCKINLEDAKMYEMGGELIKMTRPEDLAYVIYTSGSTGKPKGVMVAHQNIVNTLLWRKAEYEFTTEDKVLQNFSVAFDGFVASFFTTIITGATAVFVGVKHEKDAGYLAKTILNEGITQLLMVPILYKAILLSGYLKADNHQLKKVCVAGDRLDIETVKLSEKIVPNVELINEYGPTENAVSSSILRKVSSHKKITIGHPITNCYVYIVDKDLKILPIGVKGEICVGGKGVTKGYLNQLDLTQERFVENPYRKGELLYHTGDLGRWLSNGEIEFIRRIDKQIQVRGYRVELGEIENVLLGVEGVEECVVLAHTEDENTQLYAYYVAEKVIEKANLRQALKVKLPYYMIPSYFIHLPQMPVTPNGKIDRKALLDLEVVEESKVDKELTSREVTLLPLCLQAFKCTQLSKEENFFDIGADSLRLISLQTLLLKQGLEVPIEVLYEKCSLEELASYIELHQEELRYKDQAVNMPQEIQMSETAVQLKVSMQRKMTTYLHRSLPMCILMAYEAYWPWYYSNFVQIYGYVNEEGYVELNYLEPFDGYVDVAEVICLGYPLLKDVVKIGDYIEENIARGYYVIVHFDEYYLPHKWAYQKEHFVHSSLVYGYDQALQQMYLISFDDQMTFTKLSYDRTLLEKAYEAGKMHYKESAAWCEWSALQLIKPRTPQQVFPFSMQRFKAKLKAYIEGKDDGYTFYTLGLNAKKVVYGKAVYEMVIQCLTKVLDGEICIDYRAIHLLYEHKIGLLERFEYIAQQYKVAEDFKANCEEYKVLIKKCNVMRLKFKAMQELERSLTCKQRETIVETIALLKQMAQEEEALLIKIYKGIDVD